MSTPDTLARRVADALARRGSRIMLRRITTSAAPHLMPSPPTLVLPLLDGPELAGATTIDIRATDARGRLVAGDKLRIGAVTYRVTATVNSRALGSVTPGFDDVPIAPALLANTADGAGIVPTWAADEPIAAKIQAYPQHLVDGSRIQASDLMVTVAAFNITKPDLTDKLIVDGDIRAIMAIRPSYAGDTVVRWELQAR